MSLSKLLLPIATLFICAPTWAQNEPPACSPNSEACQSSCVNSGLMSNPVTDCRRHCSQWNSDYKGYCYARAYPNKGLTMDERKAIYEREADACSQRECDGPYTQSIQGCVNMTDRSAKISCSTNAVNAKLRCFASCASRAKAKAMSAQ